MKRSFNELMVPFGDVVAGLGDNMGGFQCRGVLLIRITVGHLSVVLAVGTSWGCLALFALSLRDGSI